MLQDFYKTNNIVIKTFGNNITLLSSVDELFELVLNCVLKKK
jgi:hypothetical protein